MIIDVTNEVYTKLKTDLTNVTVLSYYPSVAPTFPLVTITEMDNRNKPETKDSAGDKHNDITLELSIFTTGSDMVSQAKTIRKSVDEIMADYYGMNRESAIEVPNFIDSSIYRYVMRYSFSIDSNKVIYR